MAELVAFVTGNVTPALYQFILNVQQAEISEAEQQESDQRAQSKSKVC
jgi:hypothetical protein